jgi:hypothetical protein
LLGTPSIRSGPQQLITSQQLITFRRILTEINSNIDNNIVYILFI